MADEQATQTMKAVDCSVCVRKTTHLLLFEKRTCERETLICDAPVLWYADGYDYSVFECQGCHNVVMRKALWSSDLSPEDYDPSYVSWHPPIASRQVPKWHKRMPASHVELLSQIYQCLHAKSYSLALMGLRAMFDMFIVAKIGDRESFKEKLDALVSEGFLSGENRKLVEPALEAGSAAAHRGYVPTEEVMIFVLDVLETLLQQDLLQSSVDSVRGATPSRPRRKPKAPKNDEI